jgi:hypothetical protein
MERDVVEKMLKVVPSSIEESVEVDPLEDLLSGEIEKELIDTDYYYEQMLEQSQEKENFAYDVLLDGIKRAQYLTRKISYYKKYF